MQALIINESVNLAESLLVRIEEEAEEGKPLLQRVSWMAVLMRQCEILVFPRNKDREYLKQFSPQQSHLIIFPWLLMFFISLGIQWLFL